jgi:hypothetical protein
MLAGAAAAALTPSGEDSACAALCGMRSRLASAVVGLFVAGVEAAALPSRALALPSRSFSLLLVDA